MSSKTLKLTQLKSPWGSKKPEQFKGRMFGLSKELITKRTFVKLATVKRLEVESLYRAQFTFNYQRC